MNNLLGSFVNACHVSIAILAPQQSGVYFLKFAHIYIGTLGAMQLLFILFFKKKNLLVPNETRQFELLAEVWALKV